MTPSKHNQSNNSTIIKSGYAYRKEGSYIKKWKKRWIILSLCHERNNTYWLSIHKSSYRKKHLMKPIKKIEITTSTLIINLEPHTRKFSVVNTKLHQQIILKCSSSNLTTKWIECLNLRQEFLKTRVDHKQKNSKPHIIQLFLNGDFLRKLTSIKVDAMITILELKQMISVKYKIDKDRMRLCLGDNKKPLLQTELTLMDYNIYDLSTIHIYTLYCPFNININLNQKILKFGRSKNEGHTLFNLDSNSSVKDIKEEINKRHLIPINEQCLKYNDKIMSDRNKLNDYELDNGKTLDLIIKKSKGYLDKLIKQNVIKPICGSYKAKEIGDIFWNSMETKNMEKIYILRIMEIKHNLKRNETVFESILKSKALQNGEYVDDDDNDQREMTLFHGCSVENVENIIYNGFDRNYNVRDLYGRGTYFSNDSFMASKYCKLDNISGHYVMFVCRVYIGDYCVGYRNMKLSALYKSDNGSVQYDSFVNDLYQPSIFVINRDYHAIPTHLIEFKIKNQWFE